MDVDRVLGGIFRALAEEGLFFRRLACRRTLRVRGYGGRVVVAVCEGNLRAAEDDGGHKVDETREDGHEREKSGNVERLSFRRKHMGGEEGEEEGRKAKDGHTCAGGDADVLWEGLRRSEYKGEVAA